MKLKYVSVLRKPGLKTGNNGYWVTGELESQPASLWFKYFQLIWVSTPQYRKICSEPKLSKNTIIIPIKNSDLIIPALDALRKIVARFSENYDSLNRLPYMITIDEAMI